MRARSILTSGLLTVCAIVGCDRPSSTGADPGDDARVPVANDGVELVVLGSAQDGGIPHTACSCRRCGRARVDPVVRRSGPSLAIVVPGMSPWLIDASPDLPAQLARLGTAVEGRVDRDPLSGVLLTHAHIGHYLGLAFLGREVVHTTEVPVFATPAMAAFLEENAPWGQLVRLGNIRLRATEPGSPIDLGGGVVVRAIRVPHRDEYADTVAYRIEGPMSTVLYVPDTDRWESWDPPIETHVAEVDVALLDGTFYALDELPGRTIEQVPHPLVTHTMDRLDPIRRTGVRVVFTHFNHSNPVVEPESDAARTVRSRGYEIAVDGLRIGL